MSKATAWEPEMLKILTKINMRRDSEPFRDPVQWQMLGLTDYVDIVKYPMDLGTVKKKLDSKDYKKLEQCAADIRLIWSNAMLYNQPGSLVYKAAKSLSDFFEGLYSVLAANDVHRPPSVEEMCAWIDYCCKLDHEELGRVLVLLEKNCPRCLIKKADTNEVVLEVDLVPPAVFRAVLELVRECLPELFPARPPPSSVPSSAAPTTVEDALAAKRKAEAYSDDANAKRRVKKE